MRINFIYSIESELDRVRDAFRRKDHFLKYNYIVRLPEGFSLDKDNLENLESQIKKEIINPLVDETKSDISNNWAKYHEEVIGLLASVGGDIPDEINVVLTKYGVGGSYWPPQKVIINVNYKKCFENFVHELTHCCLEESIIRKYHLNHRQKEGVIDWIFLNNPFLKTIFPNYNQQRMSVLPNEKFIDKANLHF